MKTGTRIISRFVSEDERGSGDINTVSSTHIETVCLLERAGCDEKE